MRLLAIATLFLPGASALYFYLEGPQKKCFFEELPKDTLVVGTYRAEEWNPDTTSYTDNPNTGIQITVEEVFDNDHRVVNQKGHSNGRFTFTAAESGEHRLCLQTNAGGGWFTKTHVKLHLDLAIGATSKIERADKGKMNDLVQRVKDLENRLLDIKREQVFQREREAEFRDQSESTNARVVRWTIVQLFVLAVTCAWQLTHLRGFFQKQKIV